MARTIKECLERGPSTSKEIQAVTGLSQSSVARRLKDMGDKVVQIQEGRSIRYAATCNAFGGNDKLPLGIAGPQGNSSIIAHIRPLSHGGFFVEPAHDIPPMLLGGNNGLFEDLPYYLFDLRPQGFLGWQIARKIASQSEGFPSDPRLWTNNHIGRYLISNGEDLPGNLIFGEQSLLRVQRKPVAVSESDYPGLADNVMKGELPGSSAGGEHPKFTAYNGNLDSHVIVKFSPGGDNEIAQRWKDILVTEYHAAKVINNAISPAADTRLFEMDGRYFIEMQRFDRHGEFGRSSMISLKSIDDEFAGIGHNWVTVMTELFNSNLVSEKDLITSKSLWYFGRLINNVDMHLGNLSLAMEKKSFSLLPVYDMCSMGFAPRSDAEVQPFSFEASDILNADVSDHEIEKIKGLAYDFWEDVSKDDRISRQFKNFLDRGNPVEKSSLKKG